MVDMYEEDFDSNDEMQLKMNEMVMVDVKRSTNNLTNNRGILYS